MRPVITNEFELVAAPPRADATSAAAAGEPSVTTPAQSPAQETERLIRHHGERALRVWAH
jgi:hypothetical protein